VSLSVWKRKCHQATTVSTVTLSYLTNFTWIWNSTSHTENLSKSRSSLSWKFFPFFFFFELWNDVVLILSWVVSFPIYPLSWFMGEKQGQRKLEAARNQKRNQFWSNIWCHLWLALVLWAQFSMYELCLSCQLRRKQEEQIVQMKVSLTSWAPGLLFQVSSS
jgi:Zn-dependent protease with chaperone function